MRFNRVDIKNYLKKNIKNIIFALAMFLPVLFLNFFYEALDNPSRGVHNLVTPIDKSIPFLKIFVIPYVLWYLYIAVVMLFLCIADRDTYYKTLFSYMLGLIISYIVFFFYQTTVLRPTVTGNDFLSWLLLIVWGNDKPYNCFPSIHVIVCYIIVRGIAVCKEKSRAKTISAAVVSFFIIISTLFVRQHVIMDVLSGMIVGELAFMISEIFGGGRIFSWLEKQFLSLTTKKKLET